ncbi:MAG TPA: hypothetical protein VN279_03585 [Rhodocyclaceae bacterium]|jgi:hypothetical protein|nr:hypothetical protein [Rhodocyclaceae bacterium]
MNSILGRRAFRSIARILAVLVVLVQTIAAVHACSPAERLATYLATESTAGHSGCHEQAAPDTGACLMHCSTADQSLDVPVAAVAPVAIASLPASAWPPEPQDGLRPEAGAAAIPEAPIPIRLGSFRS